MPRLSARSGLGVGHRAERILHLEGGPRPLLPREEEVGARGQPLGQPRRHRLLHGDGRFQGDAGRRHPRAAGVEGEVVARDREGHLLELAVEAEVGLEELLAAALHGRAATPEVQEDPGELELRRHAEAPRW